MPPAQVRIMFIFAGLIGYLRTPPHEHWASLMRSKSFVNNALIEDEPCKQKINWRKLSAKFVVFRSLFRSLQCILLSCWNAELCLPLNKALLLQFNCYAVWYCGEKNTKSTEWNVCVCSGYFWNFTTCCLLSISAWVAPVATKPQVGFVFVYLRCRLRYWNKGASQSESVR